MNELFLHNGLADATTTMIKPAVWH